jgi:hypothetical protein
LQDDLAKFVSEPVLPPQLVEVPEEGKAKTKERREVGEGDTQLSLKTCPMRTTMRRRCRSVSSCGRGSAVLACLISLSFRIRQLA